MGKRLEYACKYCAAVFFEDMGNGFDFAIKRCGSCRKKVVEKHGIISLENCGCGGLLGANEMPHCPECGSKEVLNIGYKFGFD